MSSPHMLYAIAAIFTILPTVAVILRFWARAKKRQPFKWDDWTIVFSLVACIATGILMILHVAIGMLGEHIKMSHGKPVYGAKFYIFQRFLFANDITQVFAIGPTKISVLLFYRRIFHVKRSFQFISMTLINLAAAWTISFFLTNLLQFLPIEGWWTIPPNKKTPGLDLTKMYLAQSYADVALDVIIISLPIPLIWSQMSMSLSRKIGVSFVFLLGSLTTAASIARTVVQYRVVQEYESRNPDRTYFLAPIIYWPLIEASLGIVAACLPLLRPIWPSLKEAFIRSKRSVKTLVRVRTQESRSESDTMPDMSVPPKINAYEKKEGEDRWLRAYDVSGFNDSIDREMAEHTRNGPDRVNTV